MKHLLYILAVSVLVFAAGCAAEKTVVEKKLGFGFKDRGNYPKLKDYKLSLELSPGTRRFRAGEAGELTFILRNTSGKALRIPEWYKFDPNNLDVSCQIWMPVTSAPDPDMWLNISMPVRRPVWRYPLTIPAGEKVFVSTRLDFPANLVISPGAERRYFIKARLNLKSVEVNAPVEYITILPGEAPVQRNLKKNPAAGNK